MVTGPEAAVGGMIGLLKDGDEIVIDAIKGEINVNLSAEEISKEKKSGNQEQLIIIQVLYDSQQLVLLMKACYPPGAKEETHTYADI